MNQDKTHKSIVHQILDQREINFLLTSAYCIFIVYCVLVALFHREFLHPLITKNSTVIRTLGGGCDGNPTLAFDSNEEYMSLFSEYDDDEQVINRHMRNGRELMSYSKFPTQARGVTWLHNDDVDGIVRTILSLFLLWTVALALGRIAAYLVLPPLFGMCLAGFVFANFSTLRGILEIHQKWADVTRQVAFTLCLIRCGIAVDYEQLKKSWKISAILAVSSATCEVFAVVLLLTFAFGIPVEIAVIFAFVLGSNSPPLTITEMVLLKQKRLGTQRALPQIIGNALAIDNTYCVMSFIAVTTLIFRREIQDPVSVAAQIIADIIVGIGLGIIAGIILRVLPRSDAALAHFTRTAILLMTSLAFLLGSLAIRRKIAGPAAVLAVSIVAARGWRDDNSKKAQAIKSIWELLIQPLTLTLIGILIDFYALNRRLLIEALLTLFLAFSVRLIATFLISFIAMKLLVVKERLFIGFSFTPKATAQAIIFPFMVGYCSIEPHTRFVALTGALSIILTSPLSSILSRGLGPRLLSLDYDIDLDESHEKNVENREQKCLHSNIKNKNIENTVDERPRIGTIEHEDPGVNFRAKSNRSQRGNRIFTLENGNFFKKFKHHCSS